ncbi:replication initiator protein A [Deinococcus cellulosilyticus]|uniref:Uncharacterized protein n=1 Tax=Deinococcus cellulosilyticus (strain DSM 18568 / NBRC 106333 / KACC 11606 / 5516J-15) TaxID=1223518 RepID=A0A511NAI4_DEIC1|nr:replication initiator protein A [Deinococcus cellulosilyticus]GEM49839.1 hypothetical protein DC3_54740 [Deinococcus cellulosilyticus NBRC 106333 = KACC 11606]
MSKSNKSTDRRDERNLAKVGVISIQARVDTTITTIKSEFAIEDVAYRVEGVTPYGRPHGIDTDVIVAAQTLFVRQGCPEHGWVHTTAYELRELSGLPNNGLSYDRLRESLKRLWATGFLIGEGITDPAGKRKWDTDTMRYIDRIKYRENDDQDLPGLDASASLSIKLGDQLSESIRAGFTQVLDGRLLLQLEQPPARALYRLLEAHRVDRGGQRRMELTVSLEDWRQACGISSDRPEIVRRTLTPAHDELIAVKYLESVTLEGRGKKQFLHYRFQTDGAPDPALVEMLIGVGFARGAAMEVVKVHEDRVEAAVGYARQRKADGYQIKNMPGLIVDFLKSPDKYALSPSPAAKAVAIAEAVRLGAQQAEEEARKQFEQEQAQIKTLSPAEQYQEAKAALNLLLKKHLSKDEMKLLEQACLSGRIMAAELKEQVTLATGRLTLGEFIEDLKGQLH